MTKQQIEERRDKVVRLYIEEEKSINQIANEWGIDWSTVKRDLVSRNVEIQKTRNQYKSSNGISNTLFKEIKDSDSAYWLGFLYADGSIRKDRNEITLDLQEQDRKTIEDFHSYCGNKNSIREHNINRNKSQEIIKYNFNYYMCHRFSIKDIISTKFLIQIPLLSRYTCHIVYCNFYITYFIEQFNRNITKE